MFMKWGQYCYKTEAPGKIFVNFHGAKLHRDANIVVSEEK
jgi:hypothetical protein